MRRSSYALAISIGLLVASLCTAPAAAAHVGKKALNFTGKDAVSGKSIALEDFRGQVVLVDFWATWCGPCVGELPNVKSAYEQYKEQGFVVISISLDNDKAKCKSFINDRGMTWVNIVDGGGWKTRLAKKFSINSIPKMFLIDRDGVCVSDSARGGALGPAIEKALKKPASQPPEPKPEPKSPVTGDDEPSDSATAEPSLAPTAKPALDPAAAEPLLAELKAADESLLGAQAVLSGLVKRLEAAKQAITALDPDLPSPRRPAAARDAYLRIRTDITDLRRELFMLGLLNERTIAVPANPFVSATNDELTALFQAKGQLPTAAASIETMRLVLEPEWTAIVQSQSELRSLTRDVSDGRGLAGELRSRCSSVREDCGNLAERWSGAWRDQLAQLHEIVAQLHAPTAQLTARCDEIDGRIAAVRQEVKARPATDADLTALRDEFGSICAAVKELAAQVQSLGGAKVAKLPVNPLERKSLHDRMALPELEIQLMVAADAAGQLRKSATALSGPAQQKAQAFLPRIQGLQGEIAGESVSEQALAGVREKYSTLCGEILASTDKT